MWLRKKKKLQSLIGFLNANKIDHYNRGLGKGGKKRIQKNLQNKSKHKNNKCFSWVTVSVLSLVGSHSPPYLPRMPSKSVLISGPAVGAAQVLIWSYPCVFLPPMSTAIRTSAFSFVRALNGLLYCHRHKDCLVDHVDLICRCTACGKGLVFFLCHTALGFNCGFSSTSTCRLFTGV